MPPDPQAMLRALHQAGGTDAPEMEQNPQPFEPNDMLAALEQARSDEDVPLDEMGSGEDPSGSGDEMNKVDAKTGWRRTALPVASK